MYKNGKKFSVSREAIRYKVDSFDLILSNQVLIEFLVKVYKDNIHFRIVCELCKVEGAGLRELARRVGIAHSNMASHLNILIKNGVVESFRINPRVKVYRLSPRFQPLKTILKNQSK